MWLSSLVDSKIKESNIKPHTTYLQWNKKVEYIDILNQNKIFKEVLSKTCAAAMLAVGQKLNYLVGQNVHF